MILNFGGLPINISFWHFLLLGVFWLSGVKYVTKHYSNAPKWKYTLAGLASFIVVFLSLVLHEISHGIVASLFGIPVTEAGVTFWGAYVKLDSDAFMSSAWAVMLIGLAGPLTNVLLGLLFAIPVRLLGESALENTFQYFSHMNFELALWNFAPLVVTDGTKIVMGFFMILGANQDQAFVYSLAFTGGLLIWYLFLRDKTKKAAWQETLETL